MKRIKLFIYTIALITVCTFTVVPAFSQPNPPGPPGGGPPGDPGGDPHNQVPFTGLELLVLAGGWLGFRKIQQGRDKG